jgi:ribosomal protein L40E
MLDAWMGRRAVPCYRCGTRQVDPEPGKPSPWLRGVVSEHQVLICPDCYPAALVDLTQCTRCQSVRLIKRLDQIECLDCRLTRDADPVPASTGRALAGQRCEDSGLAAEVASALARVLGTQ